LTPTQLCQTDPYRLAVQLTQRAVVLFGELDWSTVVSDRTLGPLGTTTLQTGTVAQLLITAASPREQLSLFLFFIALAGHLHHLGNWFEAASVITAFDWCHAPPPATSDELGDFDEELPVPGTVFNRFQSLLAALPAPARRTWSRLRHCYAPARNSATLRERMRDPRHAEDLLVPPLQLLISDLTFVSLGAPIIVPATRRSVIAALDNNNGNNGNNGNSNDTTATPPRFNWISLQRQFCCLRQHFRCKANLPPVRPVPPVVNDVDVDPLMAAAVALLSTPLPLVDYQAMVCHHRQHWDPRVVVPPLPAQLAELAATSSTTPLLLLPWDIEAALVLDAVAASRLPS
jgi:hypothetical protein